MKKISILALTLSCVSSFSPARPALPARTLLRAVANPVNPAVIEMANVQCSKARDFIEEAELPDELAALEAVARDETAEQTDIGAKIYELLIVMSLDFQGDASTVTMKRVDTPDVFDRDYPGIKEKMTFLYQYGFQLLTNSILTIDLLKELIQQRLCQRMGMTGEQFDEWLDS